jgi:hypothetical protein
MSTYLPKLKAVAAPTGEAMTALTTLAAQIPCGSPQALDPALENWDVWQSAFHELVWGPWAFADHAALQGFQLPTSPFFQDRGIYEAATWPSAAVMFADRALALVRPAKTGGSTVRELWLADLVATQFEIMQATLFPNLMNDEEVEASTWDLTSGESAALALVEASRPAISGDCKGAYTQWLDAYYRVLTNGVQASASDTYPQAELALDFHSPGAAACPRKHMLERFAQSEPKCFSDADGGAWLGKLSAVLLAVISLGDSADFVSAIAAEHLALFELVRPPILVGLSNYSSWLDSFVLAAQKESLLTDHVLPIKPCLMPGEEDAGQAAFSKMLMDYPELPQAVTSLAAPTSC